MAPTVLVPHDGSTLSADALAFADERFTGADLGRCRGLDPLTAAYETPVESSLPWCWEDWYEDAVDGATADLERAAAEVEAPGRSEETVVEIGKHAAVILERVEAVDADHVGMGSHGRDGLPRLLLGSVAERVLRRAPVPVTIVR